ncbi:hypothetical protein BGX26_007979 [Mortierella sp. AD094]|nr:hypothetical protein BGX26_007979 [Mortierella sp. AD094]
MQGTAMKKSHITLARAILMICIASMMLALLHIHYISFYNREQAVANNDAIENSDIQHPIYDNNIQPSDPDSEPENINLPTPTPTSTSTSTPTPQPKTDIPPASPKPEIITAETKLSFTTSYINGTVTKEFKPAFYKDPQGARDEMGSFLDTLAERHSRETIVSKGFFSYLPMGGGNNQFSSLEKAALLAKDLNRTLVIPPISPSSHIKLWSGPRYSEFYDLEDFSAKSGISVAEWHDIKQTPENPTTDLTRHWTEYSEEFPCIANGGIGVNNKNLYDHFRPQFLMNFKAVEPPVKDRTMGKATEYAYAKDVLLQDKDAKNPDVWKCLSCPYFLNGPSLMDRAWKEVGLHMRFTDKIEGMVDGILDILLPKSKDVNRRHPEFIVVHLRRGDIVTKCKKGQSEEECLVQIEEIAERVDTIEKKRRIKALDATNENNTDVVLERLPVLVTTNEKRPKELEKLEKLGWILLDHGDKKFDSEGIEIPSKTIKLGTMSSLGEFYPPMIDAVLLTRGDYLIGMANSRMSQLATQRGAAWYGHTTMLM